MTGAAQVASQPGARSDADVVPDRDTWPEPAPHTEAGRLLTELIIATFRLNSRLMEAAQGLASAGELTAARWQVLGGVLDRPRTVAEIGRLMGMSRQGVQRIADLLVEDGLADYRSNPAHRRAKLLACSEAGHWAIRRIALGQHPWTNRVGARIGTDELQAALETTDRLVAVLDDPDVLDDPGDPDPESDDTADRPTGADLLSGA